MEDALQIVGALHLSGFQVSNPDDLPDNPVPVGVAIQYNAGSYTCKSCDTCLTSDKELTEHVNEEGHRGAFQVNRRGCK